MKKMFFMAAIAGVALASCAKNEVETPEQDIITFAEPVTAVQTKAVEIGENYPTSQSFSVFADYFTEKQAGYTKLEEGKAYMRDVIVSYNGELNGWASATNYYWPKQGTLTFAAYSPSSVAASYGKSGIKFTDFTVDTDCTKQFDLLFSERTYNQTKADMVTNEPYSGVELKFNHALSSILFTVKTDKDYYNPDNFSIILNKISIKNVKTTATFDQGLVDGLDETTKVVTNDFSTSCWSGHAGSAEYVAYQDAQTLTTTPEFTENINVTNPRENDVNNTNLILLPQEFDKQQIYIEYQIVNGNTGVTIDQNETIDLAYYDTCWKRGKRYIYNLTFAFDKIYFNPVVADWDEINVYPTEIGK